jgi:hypothetical protein
MSPFSSLTHFLPLGCKFVKLDLFAEKHMRYWALLSRNITEKHNDVAEKALM